MREKPKATSSFAEQQLDKAQSQFEAFDQSIKDMTLDRMNEAPKLEQEPIHKISSEEVRKSKDIYLKPERSLSSREKFNEDYRKDYEFASEYVQFTAENREIIGEAIEMWTKPFAGMPAQFWRVPVGKVVWAPRFVAEQIKKAKYHRLTMQQNVTTGSDGMGSYYGSMVADQEIQRLDAFPASQKISVFMGAKNF